MENKIENIRLKFNCPAAWEDMTVLDGGRYCKLCEKKVYDFTDAKRDEFLKILFENGGSVCGRFRAEQAAPLVDKSFPWKKWISAALVLVGINIFNNKAEAQKIKLKPSSEANIDNPAIISGMIDQIMPQFQGGIDSFHRFLSKNLHYNKGMKNGKVVASFTVQKNGRISNIKIIKSVSSLNDNEVMRVLELSPRWIPGKENNKPIATEMMIPVNFYDDKLK